MPKNDLNRKRRPSENGGLKVDGDVDRRIGNNFWTLRSDFDSEAHRKMSPEMVLEKSQEYVSYCLTNHLMATDFRGKEAQEVQVPKMRAMTLTGLCMYIGISTRTWKDWRKIKKYSLVIAQVEECMRTQKFEGAAAGLLNPNIIARDLGLVDQKAVEKTTKLTASERKKRIQELISKGVIGEDQVDLEDPDDNSDSM